MPFPQRGYFGSEAEKFVQQHRAELKIWFETMEALNEIAHEILANIKVNSVLIQEMTCASLFLRVLSSFSAAFKLLELGLSKDAGTIIRSEVESAIFLKACSQDYTFVEDLHHAHDIFRLKIINLSLEGKPGAIEVTGENRHILEAKKAELKINIESNGIKEIQVAQIAEKYGMVEMYNTAYRMLSNASTHTSSKSLEDFFKFKSDGSVEAIIWSPNISNADHLMFTMCAALTVSFESINSIFNIPEDVTSRLDTKTNLWMEKLRANTKNNTDKKVF